MGESADNGFAPLAPERHATGARVEAPSAHPKRL
jgi:hypothetical protein